MICGILFKGRSFVADSASRGVRHQLTAYSQNLRGYESSNQTSRTREPLGDMGGKRERIHALFNKKGPEE